MACGDGQRAVVVSLCLRPKRETLDAHKELAKRLDELGSRIEHKRFRFLSMTPPIFAGNIALSDIHCGTMPTIA